MIADKVIKDILVSAETLPEEDSPRIFKKKEEKDPIPNAIKKILPPKSPGKGSITGEQFLARCKDAGKRISDKYNEVTGETVKAQIFQPALQRQDMILAIHAYIGYDSRLNFGEQESRARSQAQQELHPVKAEEYKRCAIKPSIAGYVAGVPNPEKRLHDNVMAKILLGIDALKDAKGNFRKSAFN